MSRNGKKRGYGKRFLTVLLALAMIVSLTPSLGALTGGAFGAQEVYAAESISGTVNASELIQWQDYTLTGDTTIYIDADQDVLAINIGSYNLTIEGDGEHELCFQGISGYSGKLEIKSGKLSANYSVSTGNWPAAIVLTSGEFKMSGGELFIDFDSQSESANTAYGICAKAFTMSGGKATVYCLTEENGYASGISCGGFDMSGGILDATGETFVSGKTATGIDASGSTADADFTMTGGEVNASGIAKDGDDSYGINWTADITKNTMVISGGKLTAEGSRHGIASWVPVSISGGADVTANSTNNVALHTSEGTITIQDMGTKVTACSANSDAINTSNGTIKIASGVKIIQPENGYVATYGGNSQSIRDASDEWAKQVVIEGVGREEIKEIVATSNITTPEYGAEIPVPEITVQDGAPAYFSSATWYKKNGDVWEEVTESTFSEGTYHCSGMIRIDEGGTEYMLGWPLKVTVNGVAWTSGWNKPEVNDTCSSLGIESPDYVVEKCPSGGAHDWQIVNHKGSFTADGYQSMECSKCGKQHEDGIAIGALKVKTAKLEKTSYVYTGKAIKPTVTLASADGPLNKDYYTVSYADSKGNAVTSPTNVGTYKAVITLKGDYYEGTKELTFKITPKTISPKVTLSTAAYTWNGKVKKPTVTVKNGSTKLATSQYTVSYADSKGNAVTSPTNVGQYTITVKPKDGGNYTFDAVKKTFKINPKGTTLTAPSGWTVTKSAVTVKWNKQATKMSTARITGYQVQIATNSSFTAGKKSVKISGYSKVSKKFTGLKSGKKYYVRVRTYKTINGATCWSPWSATKTVTTKK